MDRMKSTGEGLGRDSAWRSSGKARGKGKESDQGI